MGPDLYDLRNNPACSIVEQRNRCSVCGPKSYLHRKINTMSFANKTALITGATRGIGKSHCLKTC